MVETNVSTKNQNSKHNAKTLTFKLLSYFGKSNPWKVNFRTLNYFPTTQYSKWNIITTVLIWLMVWPTLLLKHIPWYKICIVKFTSGTGLNNLRKQLHFKLLEKMPRVVTNWFEIQRSEVTCPLTHSWPREILILPVGQKVCLGFSMLQKCPNELFGQPNIIISFLLILICPPTQFHKEDKILALKELIIWWEKPMLCWSTGHLGHYPLENIFLKVYFKQLHVCLESGVGLQIHEKSVSESKSIQTESYQLIISIHF